MSKFQHIKIVIAIGYCNFYGLEHLLHCPNDIIYSSRSQDIWNSYDQLTLILAAEFQASYLFHNPGL
jgi:hypothetical protein